MGFLPLAPGGVRFVLLATDYFTKWVEAQAYNNIIATKVIKLVRTNILTSFGIPMIIMTNNFKMTKLQPFVLCTTLNVISLPRFTNKEMANLR